MRKTIYIAPVMTVIAGTAGYFLRQLELGAAFEPSGFAIPGAQETQNLMVLSLAFALVAVLIAAVLSKKLEFSNEYVSAFSISSLIVLFLNFILGAGIVASAVFYYLGINISYLSLEAIHLALAALSGISVMVASISAYKGKSYFALPFFSVIPSVFLCVWLIIVYKDNSANPVLISYAYQSLAIAAAALSFYYSAGFVYGRSKPFRTLLSSMLAVFFVSVAAADTMNSYLRYILLLMTVNILINIFALLSNAKLKNRHIQ